jgi:hypothetical protein
VIPYYVIGGLVVLVAYVIHGLYRKHDPSFGDLGVLGTMVGAVVTGVALGVNAYRSATDPQGVSYMTQYQYLPACFGAAVSALFAIVKMVGMFRAQAIPKVGKDKADEVET